MLIWILALVLFGCLGYAGYALGVIRATVTFIGLLVAALLAWPMGPLLNPVLGMTGLKNPIIIWLLGPFVAFCIILTIFKVIGFVVNRKVDVYYKYKAGDLKQGLWNRLNARLGLCVGLANAAVYLILISTVIYVFSYATIQIANAPESPWLVKLLNTAGQNVQDTGLNKVAAALDPLPDTYYQAVDMIGLIYHNDLLEGRLSRYPAFLAMGERPEFQEIGKDKQFTEMRMRQAPIGEILENPKAQSIINNPDLLKEIWGIVVPNMSDLKNYLLTGKSANYDDPILGGWTINLGRAIYMFKQSKPNIDSREMALARRAMTLMFGKTTLVAAPDKQVFVKNLGKIRPPPKPAPNAKPAPPPPLQVDMQTLQGHWDGGSGKYELEFPGLKRKLQATIEGDRMTITFDNLPLVLDRDY